MTPYEQALGPARQALAGFIDTLERAGRTLIFCHFDADGLAAGALLGRGLERLGFSAVQVIHSLRGESAFSAAAGERLGRHAPQALLVTDLGVDAPAILPGVPTLLLDHHRPEGQPVAALAISGYGWEPTPCSAWLAYELLAPLVELDDLAWIAAIGILSDLGDRAPWPRLAGVKQRYTAKWLKEAVALVNAARRARAFDVQTALQLLLQASHPRAVSEDAQLGAPRLHAYRAEVNAALRQARRQAPVFSRSQPIALIRLSSGCQIHPLIAEQWRRRLSDYVVIAANSGYLPDRVAFAARTSRSDISLPLLFQSVDLGGYHSSSYGRGHEQASGGHLPPALFERLLQQLGFEV